jgi:hypothetical protein
MNYLLHCSNSENRCGKDGGDTMSQLGYEASLAMGCDARTNERMQTTQGF